LGYVLFYGWSDLLFDPLYVFRRWDGGMASHGGIIGVGLWLLYYAKKKPTSISSSL
jgi:phosphatidylglycerol:prolipoprotein diacylglycerol transferase